MGMGMNAAGNVMGGFQQPVNQQPQQTQQQTQQQEDPYEKLAKLKNYWMMELFLKKNLMKQRKNFWGFNK